ncbi:GTPase [Paenibacillus swuensis]|uniref:GTPase n=1 Tax=Paenibacillus swuensis TaxID=1178515 RepID=A0A172TK23_9BACL|nr:ribosome biogenesis GTPase YqeH [Paenibacillus swuensis]ANE47264.1 GTPase [Paenibacillus swuensis]
MATREGQNTATSCSGCGVKLQTTDASKLGYIPEQALDREPVICQRCFRIKNYNEAANITLDQGEFLKILGHVAEKQALVVNIVDIFDFEGSIVGGLQRFIGNNPVVLAVNKIDLLPRGMNMNRIVNWVRKQAKEQGLKVVDIVLCSAKRNMGFDKVIEVLDTHRQGRDVYVVGATNVGKSTLINRLIQGYSDLDAELTTSRYPGTTLDLVEIPLDDGKHIIDTPGIVYTSRMTELVSRKDLGTIMPDKPIKPIVFQLNEEQSLFFGALARFDFLKGERQSFTCYVSNALQIHRTKLEKADELYANHAGVMLQPPSKDELEDLPKWTKHQIRVPKGSESDIFISGIGWIRVNSDLGALLEVHAPKGIKVLLRDALI